MTTKITPAQIEAARRIVAAMPLSSEGDALAAGRTLAGLTRWRDTIVADHARDAEELLLAGIIANEQDGDPDDYLGAAAAIREHYAALADDVVDAEVVSLERQALDRIADVGLPHRGSPYPFRSPSAGADPDAIADAAVGLFESWRNLNEPELFGGVKPTPSTIPADATGLKGKRARVVGPDGPLVEGTEVTISNDTPDYDSELRCSVQAGNGHWIAASSLALIPDDEEVRCGRRHSDNSRCVLDDGHDSGCRYPFIPDEPCFCGVPGASGVVHREDGSCYNRITGMPVPYTEPAAVSEPPVGTRLRDKHGDVHLRADDTNVGWYSKYRAWRSWSTMQHAGPLHQVWEDYAAIPNAARYYCSLRGACKDAYLHAEGWRAPFVSMTPFGEADQ